MKCRHPIALCGFFVCLVAGVVSAQERGRFGFGRSNSLVSLAGNEAVQKHLGVAEVDVRKLEELEDRHRDAAREAMESAGIDFRGLRDLSDDERDAKMEEIRKKSSEVTAKVNREFEAKLKETLDDDQIGRLKQILLQSQGIEALAEADVVKELGLTEEQTKKIADIRSEYERKQRGLFRGDGNQGDAFAKMRELGAERDAKAADVLTAEQKAKFDALKGSPFDLSLLRRRRD